MASYNARNLVPSYNALNHTVIDEVKFPLLYLFSSHLHHKLDPAIASIVESSDVVQCQSSGFFLIIHYMNERGYLGKDSGKKLILDSPVLKSHTGTLAAAVNLIDHYNDVEQSSVVNLALDKFCFPPSWSSSTLSLLCTSVSSGSVLCVGSSSDGVSDIEGLEDCFSVVYERGKHARLWRDNDFKDVQDYILK